MRQSKFLVPGICSLVIATTVLIIACPCAGSSDAIRLFPASDGRLEFSVLVRDADALQRASTLDTVVFDKTGHDEEAADIAIKNADIDEAQALRLAAALNRVQPPSALGDHLDKAGDMQLPQISLISAHCANERSKLKGHALLLGNR